MTNLHETCISDHLRLKTTLQSFTVITDSMRPSQISLVALTYATYCNAHTEQIWAHHGSCGLQSVINLKILLINLL